MIKKYFNNDLALKIADLVKYNPYLAKQKYEEYLVNYPCDYNSWCFNIGLLINLHDFDLAEKRLNYIESVILADEKYLSNQKNKYLKMKDIFYCRLRLFMYTDRYQEIFEMLSDSDNRYFFIESGISKLIDLYCRKKLNKKIDVDRMDDSYLSHQIVDYNYDLMLEHIKKHISEENIDPDVSVTSIFSPGFPLNDVLSSFRQRADYDKRLCLGILDDTYFFKYDNCGRVKYRTTDYFKIVCFSGTFNIITMCPSENSSELPFIDFNDLAKECDNSKVIRPSARDRFNSRYNRK